ncbi:hypothetical protein AX14_013819 [Amanita brunnescens Koide BX004]|nr:hypothetical protein AX14_013819 [Amanita brunnescens Koide BX004]
MSPQHDHHPQQTRNPTPPPRPHNRTTKEQPRATLHRHDSSLRGDSNRDRGLDRSDTPNYEGLARPLRPHQPHVHTEPRLPKSTFLNAQLWQPIINFFYLDPFH